MQKTKKTLLKNDISVERGILIVALSFDLVAIINYVFGTLALTNLATYFANDLTYILICSFASFLLSFGFAKIIKNNTIARKLLIFINLGLTLLPSLYYFGDWVIWLIIGIIIGFGSGLMLICYSYLFKCYFDIDEIWSKTCVIGIITTFSLLLTNWADNKVFRYLGPLFTMVLTFVTFILLLLTNKENKENNNSTKSNYLLALAIGLPWLVLSGSICHLNIMYQIVGSIRNWFWALPFILTLFGLFIMKERSNKSSLIYFSSIVIASSLILSNLLPLESSGYYLCQILEMIVLGIYLILTVYLLVNYFQRYSVLSYGICLVFIFSFIALGCWLANYLSIIAWIVLAITLPIVQLFILRNITN